MRHAEVDLNASYTDAGATAVDAVDGDHIDGDVELVKTGSVDTASEGTYTITYTATDSSDNSASVSRTVGVLGVKTRILNVFTDGEIDPTGTRALMVLIRQLVGVIAVMMVVRVVLILHGR